MEELAPSSSFCSSGSGSQENEKIVLSSTSQMSIARSATRGMCNVYTFLISSSVFCVLIRLGFPRLFNLFNSNSNSQSPSSSATRPSAGNQSPFSSGGPESTNGSHLSGGRPYDVFLNHRGPDVKNSLASSIYHWIQEKGLRAFLDEQEFQAGDGLHPTIEQAISRASVHIAIFSRRYAESSWCLDELCSMLKSGAKIIPVFYDVRPSDLRWVGKGKGMYADAFAKHRETGRFPSEKLDEWKAALKEVSNLHGLELNGPQFNGDCGKLLKRIGDTVSEAVVNKGRLDVPGDPVALDEAIEDFKNFIHYGQQPRNETVKIVGIVGLGGSGKTTLAKQFYNVHRSLFDKSSFLCDVRDASAKNTLQSLQSQLLKDLLHIDQIIRNVSAGKAILIDMLRYSTPRVLIILDNIDHESQIEDLVVDNVLGWGSLILITSRDEGPLRRHSQNASVYKIKPLKPKHARELFCRHAFQQPHPKIGFEDLVEEFCEKCGRLPLFLKVMGAHLSVDEKDDIDGWKNKLEYMPDDIRNILKISYDVLSEEEKQIFLDVACFFLGESKTMAIRVWRWGSTSLRKLENKCLVEIDNEKRLKMHDHLRDFARDVANEAPPFRFWHLKQITNILLPFQARIGVRGLMDHTAAHRRLSPSSFSKTMGNVFEKIELSTLKFLAVGGDCFERRFGQLSTNLSLLRWYDCPHPNITSWLISMENLTVLQLLGGRLEKWEVCHKQLPLKELKIQASGLSEISIPQDVCPHLEHLDLAYNGCLIEVEHLPTALVVLNLAACREFKSIAGSFHLKNLKVLNISSCSNLQELPNLKYLSSLETLEAGKCSKLQSIQGLEHLRKLRELDIRWCSELHELPNLSDLSSLETLGASWCRKLQTIQGLQQLRKLRELDINWCSGLRELPNLSDLSSLETLEAGGCSKLQTIQGLEHLPKLKELDISRCSELRELPNLSGLSSLETLEARECDKLQTIQGLEHLPKLLELDISRCSELHELPNLSDLGYLETLEARECGKLQTIQGLEHLPNLRELDISRCSEISALPNLSGLSSLETLEARECGKLQAIQGLENLPKLRELDISGCSELRELPGLSDLSSLETLNAGECSKLQSIQGLEHLRKLRQLDISRCSKLRGLPNLSDLTSLEKLEARECDKLQNIQGLDHLPKLRELDASGCSELREISNFSDSSSLETLEVDGCWELQSIHGLDQLQQLRLLKLSVVDHNRAILNSIQRLEKWPSTLLISGIGAASNDFSFPHLPASDLNILVWDGASQYWTSEIPARTEEKPWSAVMICFVVESSHVDKIQYIAIRALVQRGEERCELQSIVKTEWLGMIVGAGQWTCVGVFSRFTESPDTTSIYRMQLHLHFFADSLEVKKGWILTVSEENKGRILQVIHQLFTP